MPKFEESTTLRFFVVVASVTNIGLLLLFFLLFGAMNDGQTDFDVLAISLTVLEILLATIAIVGFWIIRDSAILRAQRAAEEISEVAVEKWMKKNAEPIIRRKVQDYKDAMDDKPDGADSDTAMAGFTEGLDDEQQ